MKVFWRREGAYPPPGTLTPAKSMEVIEKKRDGGPVVCKRVTRSAQVIENKGANNFAHCARREKD